MTLKSPRPATVYILHCADNTYYTGVAYDVQKRLFEHTNTPLGAKYTRGRQPLHLVYQETCETYGAALSREYEIKKLSRKAKEELLRQYSLKS